MSSSEVPPLLQEWMPHRVCINNNLWVLGVQVPSDLLIWAAYMVFGAGLIYDWNRNHSLIRQIGGVGVVRVLPWVGIFIFSCGLTHLVDVITVWRGWYMLEAWAAFSTAIASWVTIFVAANALRKGTWQQAASVGAAEVFAKALEATRAATKQVERELRRQQARET